MISLTLTLDEARALRDAAMLKLVANGGQREGPLFEGLLALTRAVVARERREDTR